MIYKDGDLVECETFYHLKYQKNSFEKAVKLEAIANRQKGEKESEYVCKLENCSGDFPTFVSRSLLIAMGFTVQVQCEDCEDEKQGVLTEAQSKHLSNNFVRWAGRILKTMMLKKTYIYITIYIYKNK